MTGVAASAGRASAAGSGTGRSGSGGGSGKTPAMGGSVAGGGGGTCFPCVGAREALDAGPPPACSAPSQQHRKAWASLSMGHRLRHRALQQPLERPYHALKQRALEHRLATAVLAVLAYLTKDMQEALEQQWLRVWMGPRTAGTAIGSYISLLRPAWVPNP